MSRRVGMPAIVVGLIVVVGGVLMLTRPFDREHEQGGDEPARPQKSERSPPKAPVTFRGDLAELEGMLDTPEGRESLPDWARAAVASHDDREALLHALIAKWESEELSDWAIESFIAEWAVVDSDGALAAVAEYSRLPHSSGHWTTPAARCGRRIAQNVPARDRERIWSELLAAENSDLNRQILAGFVQADLIEDPAAGIARLDRIPDERRDRGSEIKLAYELAVVAPALLPEFVANRSGETQQFIEMGAAPGIGLRLAIYAEETGDLNTVMRVLPRLSEMVQQCTVPKLFSRTDSGDVLESYERWERRASDLAQAGGADFSDDVLRFHVRWGGGKLVRSLDLAALSPERAMLVATSFAAQAPAPAFRWATALPATERNDRIVQEVVETWSSWEPLAASRAVAEMPPSPQRAAAAAALREEVAAREDPDLERRVAEVLGDEGTQGRCSAIRERSQEFVIPPE